MNNKLLSIAVSAAMAVTCLGSSFFGATDKTNLFGETLIAEAYGTVGVSASDTQTTKGGTATVDFSVFGDVYAQGCMLTVTYPEELTLVGGFSNSFVEESPISNYDGTASVSAMFLISSSYLSDDFTSLTFEIPEYANYRTVYDILVSVSEFSDGYEIYEDAVGIDGSITVNESPTEPYTELPYYGDYGVCASSVSAESGDTATVDFSVFGDVYAQGCMLTVTYPEELTLVGGFSGSLTGDSPVSNNDGTVSISAIFINTSGLGTDFASLTFDTFEAGFYDIEVSVSEFSDGDVIYGDAVGINGFVEVYIPEPTEEPTEARDDYYNYHNNGIDYAVYYDYDYAEVIGCDYDIETADILSEVEGKTVKAIEPHAFSNSSSLTSITIPDSITHIGANAFYNTAWYNNQPNGLLYLDNWCLGYKKFLPETDVVLKKGTVGIADYAFDYCDITSVEFSDTMKYVGDFAFSSSSALKTVTINDGLENIGEYAFHACSGLTDLTIPKVTEISDYAFFACSRLKYAEISDSVTSIGYKALGFSGSGEKMDNFVIYSTENSEAEDYALWYGFVFIDIEKPASLSQKAFTLSPGKTQILEVNNFAGEVEWYSADEDVATVNNGYIRAVGSGNTVIYAVAGDETLECTVSVSNFPVTTAVTTATPSVTTNTIPVTSKATASNTTVSTSDVPESNKATTVSTAVTTAVTTTQAEFNEEPLLIGDIVKNGEIDLYDAIEIAKSLIGMRTFTDEEKKIADYNCDGKVDLYDAIGIAKKLLEK